MCGTDEYGVPITLGWDARTDVSVLPAAAPHEVNLVRGLSSILHGPNVLGGVVVGGAGQYEARCRRCFHPDGDQPE